MGFSLIGLLGLSVLKICVIGHTLCSEGVSYFENEIDYSIILVL